MKRLLLVGLVAIASAVSARAQSNPSLLSAENANVAADLASTSAAAAAPRVTQNFWWASAEPRLANSYFFAVATSLPEPAEALPAGPEPKYLYGDRDDFRWQLGLGISVVRFRSSVYYATGIGSNTSVAYFTNEWFAVEGNINTSFAPTINQNQHVKFVSYGAGPKVAWRAQKWEPWAHMIAGGMHILPQVAGHSQNGLALQVGGGVDYRFYPHLSARLELDWVKTHVFGEWGNSALAAADIVLHF